MRAPHQSCPYPLIYPPTVCTVHNKGLYSRKLPKNSTTTARSSKPAVPLDRLSITKEVRPRVISHQPDYYWVRWLHSWWCLRWRCVKETHYTGAGAGSGCPPSSHRIAVVECCREATTARTRRRGHTHIALEEEAFEDPWRGLALGFPRRKPYQHPEILYFRRRAPTRVQREYCPACQSDRKSATE